MKIEFRKIKGTLKQHADIELFAALRTIEYEDRYNKINLRVFEPNKEYVFLGLNGELTVTFNESDLN